MGQHRQALSVQLQWRGPLTSKMACLWKYPSSSTMATPHQRSTQSCISTLWRDWPLCFISGPCKMPRSGHSYKSVLVDCVQTLLNPVVLEAFSPTHVSCLPHDNKGVPQNLEDYTNQYRQLRMHDVEGMVKCIGNCKDLCSGLSRLVSVTERDSPDMQACINKNRCSC